MFEGKGRRLNELQRFRPGYGSRNLRFAMCRGLGTTGLRLPQGAKVVVVVGIVVVVVVVVVGGGVYSPKVTVTLDPWSTVVPGSGTWLTTRPS